MQFKEYANYYNLLYRDKNYKEESEYINTLIKKFAPHSKSLIDLGCGTGNHAFQFENLNYEVKGVDISTSMVTIAEDKKKSCNSQIDFEEGDIRSYRDSRKYDAVVSLFHVMSYQTSNDDLEKAFATAKSLLKENGVFVFDCWYGPGVLTDLPVSRKKTFEDSVLRVTRISNSAVDFNTNIVTVDFNITIETKPTLQESELHEFHSMRYFFRPEIMFLANLYNLEIVGHYQWMNTEVPSEKDWYCVFILRLRS